MDPIILSACIAIPILWFYFVTWAIDLQYAWASMDE